MSNNPPLSPRQILVQMIFQSQDNITRLVRMQEQTLIYINDLMTKVNNESVDNKKEDEDKPTTAGTENQPTDTKPLTEAHKDI